jgi:hypothetical protein
MTQPLEYARQVTHKPRLTVIRLLLGLLLTAASVFLAVWHVVTTAKLTSWDMIEFKGAMYFVGSLIFFGLQAFLLLPLVLLVLRRPRPGGRWSLILLLLSSMAPIATVVSFLCSPAPAKWVGP